METKPNLLCIDDEKRILRSLKSLFKSTHNVYITTSPDEFENLLQKHNIHVIICDQRMPDESGTELLQFAKETHPNAVRILLTGYADQQAVIDSVNHSEVFRYVTKPWDVDELTLVVNQATAIAKQTASKQLTEMMLTDKNRRRPRHQPSILYADNNEKATRLFLRNFESQYAVTTVADVRALKLAVKNNAFSILIIDMQMSDENLESLLHFLKVQQPFLPTMLLTRYSDTNALIELINTRSISHIKELPASSTSLANSITQTVATFEQIRQSPERQLRHLREYLNETLTKEQTKEIYQLIMQMSA